MGRYISTGIVYQYCFEKKKIELPNGFEFDNSFIEIEEINNKLVVSYVSGNGHLMALNNNSFEIELDKTIARNSISFTTESDFGVYLGSLPEYIHQLKFEHYYQG